MLALPLTTWLLFHNQNYFPFLSRVTKGESPRNSHLNIARRSKSIITLILSTIRRLLNRLGRGRRSKTANMRLSSSDAINSGVHLTHLIRNIVKTPTKISTHMLKLIHNGSKICLYSRRGRRNGRWRGSRGKCSILYSIKSSRLLLSWSRLHMRPLSSQLCITPLYKFLAYNTHRVEEGGRRNGDMQVCEDACDSWRKD